MSKHPNAQQAIEYWIDALTMDEPWLGWEFKRRDVVEPWCQGRENMHEIVHDGYFLFRRRQRTININGFEVPEPLREIPTRGVQVFIAATDNYSLFNSAMYEAAYEHLLHKGLLHLSLEAALAHTKALLSFTKREE